MAKPNPKPSPHKTVAIIQARMGSSRLPGKVLSPLAGKPLLLHVLDRVRACRQISEIIVATSSAPQDLRIVEFCLKQGVACFAGSESDVLDRFYQTARRYGADTVVRLTADCPLLDPEVIDAVVAEHLRGSTDYTSNIGIYTYPEGLDTEVFSFAALERAWQQAKKPSEREHVTPYLRFSGKFTTKNFANPSPIDGNAHHWSVDTAEDFAFIDRVLSDLGGEDFRFKSALAAVAGLRAKPQTAEKATNNTGYYRSLYQEANAGAAPKRTNTLSQKWLARAQNAIPGAAGTFSKGYTQHVAGIAPALLERGQGARVWDVDGNSYIDYIQGLLPNILGYAQAEVNAAAFAQMQRGHSFSLPSPTEVLLAEKLQEIIPCAEQVRFGKNGSDATAGAVRVARAFTGRKRIAVGGYHGWQDWYIGSTTRSAGVPEETRSLTHSFPYNDLAAVDTLLTEHHRQFAAVILEPFSFTPPQPGYLDGLKKLCEKHGTLLIFDEICTGFHFGLGGAQKIFGVTPHLACFGKAMGNGFPISCIVGRKDVMKHFEEVFFSFTFAGEAASMAAALKVIEILEQSDALDRIKATGTRLQEGFNQLAREAGLFPRLESIGYPQWALLKFRDQNGQDSALVRTLFSQEVVKRGLLMLATQNLSAAHNDTTTEETLRVYAEVLKTLAGWLGEKKPERYLQGPLIQPIFKVRG